jgi:hypothetical protein
MDDRRLSDGTVRFLRRAAVILGVVLVLLSLAAGRLGLSVSGGLSRNQVCIGVAGLVLVTAGITGRKFPGLYRGTAVFLLNLFILIMAVEFLALVILKVLDANRFQNRLRKMEEGGPAASAEIVDQGRYAPYVVWRANPEIAGEGLTVTHGGNRITPGASGNPDALRVFLLGGSSMWGSGVTDSCTIPFYLQQELGDTLGIPVCAVNLAQSGFSSTQEVIELMLRLREGDIPDAVVFYDGYNDVWGAYTNGFAGGHHQQEQVAERVEGRSPEFMPRSPLLTVLQSSNTWALIHSLRLRTGSGDFASGRFVTYGSMGIDPGELAEDVVETYLGNCRIALALGEVYGFRCIFVWQPVIWFGEKPLTPFEEQILSGGVPEFPYGADPAFRELMDLSYSTFTDSIRALPGLCSFSGIFDPVMDELYIDYCGAHVNSAANRIIAHEISRLLLGVGLN